MVGRYNSVEGILRYADILSRLAKTNRYLIINNDAQVLIINDIFGLSPY